MSIPVFISICIPAYKRVVPLQRLLDSIVIQSFRDFEVIVTDDSPDDGVQQLVHSYNDRLPVSYHRNIPAAGTPQNWNESISRAKGEWIKLMHDDDWFASESSLQEFAAAAAGNFKFIFSAYTNVFEDNGRQECVFFPSSWRSKILEQPMMLLPWNVIGPPSVVMVHRSINQTYDRRLKWRVDMEFYVRLLQQEQDFTYISGALVNVGISGSQVTNSCIDQPEVELPEGLILLQKHGMQPLKKIRIYDAWWRIVRNVGVRNVQQLQNYTPEQEGPVAIPVMVRHQAFIPVPVLKFGPFSKILMAVSYIFNLKNLKNS